MGFWGKALGLVVGKKAFQGFRVSGFGVCRLSLFAEGVPGLGFGLVFVVFRALG